VLAHDWLCGVRGGELVLDAMARALAGEMLAVEMPDVGPGLHGSREHADPAWHADLILTMFADGKPQTPAIDALARQVSWAVKLPGAVRFRRWFLAMYPLAVGDLSRALAREHARRPVDLVVSTSSAAIHAIAAPKGVPHVCYVHAPARYIWSRAGEYARGGVVGRVRGAGLGVVRNWFKSWDRRTANGPGAPSLLLANSTHTQEQIRACWGRESTVLFPPVRTDLFTPDERVARDGSWLYVGALEPYKRVDVAIRAAGLARARLIVIGKGTQDAQLRALADRVAPGCVEFRGRVDDVGVIDAMRRARALVFPQVEDFGIVAAEAMACGTPVVARGAGGARDIVQDGVTGALFADATESRDSARADAEMARALVDAIARAPQAGSPAIRASAMRFSEDTFARGFLAAIAHARSLPAAP
jgi:glycosyltransferase involved in cell wall biosynthesis